MAESRFESPPVSPDARTSAPNAGVGTGAATGVAGSASASAGSTDVPPSPAAAFSFAGERLLEAIQYAGYYLAARLDLLKLTFRRILVFAALGVVGLLVGGAVVVTAGVLVCAGIAGLIGSLVGRGWVGDLVTGLAILGIVAAGTVWAMSWITRTGRAATVAAYEQRKQQQRESFGTDVHERAKDV